MMLRSAASVLTTRQTQSARGHGPEGLTSCRQTFRPHSRLRRAVVRHLTRLRQDEGGALIILSLQIFLILMIVTGISIDFIRQEELRAKIQNTLDRATLAATSLSQELDPAYVVEDYLDKAGLGYLNITPVVEEGDLNQWRRVSASTTSTMPTLFGPLVGLTSLGVGAASTAIESIGNVEISLVLDISGSMNYNINHPDNSSWMNVSPTRIEKLRAAAVNFVTKMFDTVQPAGAPAGRLSISVVPYNQQVVLGATTANAYTLSTDHTQNTCADVETLPSNSIAIDPNTTLQRTMYGDSFDYWGQGFTTNTTVSQALNSSIGNCLTNNSSATVLAFSNTKTTLVNKINSLTATGDTAIDVGARWGLALLDPSAQPATQKLINSGSVSASLTGRPFKYTTSTSSTDESAMKVLVLMTDGENTRSYSTKMEYRTGNSGLYSTKSATALSPKSENCSKTTGGGRTGTTTTYSTTDWCKLYYKSGSTYYKLDDGTTATAASLGTLYPITWQTVWGQNYTLQYTIQTFLYPGMRAANSSVTKESIYANMAIQSEYGDKDTALKNLCTTAKASNRGIIIFTVAVNAPATGQAILEQCATDVSYAYNVDASDLTNAFASIAASINSLRLMN